MFEVRVYMQTCCTHEFQLLLNRNGNNLRITMNILEINMCRGETKPHIENNCFTSTNNVRFMKDFFLKIREKHDFDFALTMNEIFTANLLISKLLHSQKSIRSGKILIELKYCLLMESKPQ